MHRSASVCRPRYDYADSFGFPPATFNAAARAEARGELELAHDTYRRLVVDVLQPSPRSAVSSAA